MLFNTPEFFAFAVLVIGIYYLLQRRLMLQNGWLVLASYAFYAFWDYRFLSLILISTSVDYTIARLLMRVTNPTRRKLLLIITICVNLGILGFFKYFNFFVTSATDLLENLGIAAHQPTLNILLPVGISFYTFQTLAYTIDVYRGRIEAERNPVNFALYVCYFPQLVAGPIERAENLLPRIRQPRIYSEEQFFSGLLLIVIGLFKKVAIADAAAVLVNQGFDDPARYSSVELLCFAYLFAFQIYGDFSGYTDIARGVSRLMGIELMLNFRQPYFASDIRDFWRRWHISLSTWLRDYLYIPLGGSHKGQARLYVNLMITMILGGIWHGANWTFVIWGTLHGLFLSIHRLFSPQEKPKSRIASAVGVFVTFHVVVLAWIFFRAANVSNAISYLTRMVTLQGGITGFDFLPQVIVALLLILMIDLPQHLSHQQDFLLYWRSPQRAAFLSALLFGILTIGARQPYAVNFIYFQF
jgi:D-alanyl-lipoteichoic acid acyltransferase DltB (MBOAT superfamily)